MALSVFRRASFSFLKARIAQRPFQVATITDHERNIIGRREIVGWGYNGNPVYSDRPDFPFPAIRWREPTSEIEALREKEKGDWHLLTLEEKKKLYRASFCQTYAEFRCSQLGEWKFVIAMTIFIAVPSFWVFYYYEVFIYRTKPLPWTFGDDARAAQFRRILDLETNPVQGIASKWDYEKDDWKK